MNYNIQNAKIASITGLLELTLEAKSTSQEHSIGVIMNIRKSHWNSVIVNLDLRLLKHGCRISQKSMEKML